MYCFSTTDKREQSMIPKSNDDTYAIDHEVESSGNRVTRRTKSKSQHSTDSSLGSSTENNDTRSVLYSDIYNSEDDFDDEPYEEDYDGKFELERSISKLCGTNSTSYFRSSDDFLTPSITSRIENRISKMFYPLQNNNVNNNSTKQNQLYHHHLTCRHSNPSSCSCLRAFDRSKSSRLNQMRNSKRERQRANYRGSMEEFVFKREDNRMKHQVAEAADFNHQLLLDSVFDDDDYDADYDDDNITVNYTDTYSSKNKSDIMEKELEEYLLQDSLEIEELTRNLSLN